MAYLGRQLSSGNYLKLDDISSQFNGTTTTFNLTSGGNLFYPGSSFSILVVLGGVVQEPESAYTIDEYQITFASAPGVSDDFFCIVLGVALGIGVPGDGTVSTTKLQDDSVTAEKLSPDALDNINATTLVVSGISTLGVATISQLNVDSGAVISGVTTVTGNLEVSGGITASITGDINAGIITATSITGVSTAGITTAYIGSVNDGPISGARNRIINGDMRIDQRNAGASVTVNNTTGFFAVDRFQAEGQATDGVFTAQRDTSAPAGFTNSLKLTVTTADASIGASQRYQLNQKLEGLNVSDLGFGSANAQSTVLSFWVRSSLTGTFGGAYRNAVPDRSYPFSYTISAADTWEYKTIVIPGETSGTWSTDNTLSLFVTWSLGSGTNFQGTAGAWNSNNNNTVTGETQLIGTLNATWYLTGVQLEVGSVATPFERRSYGQELALCQRYYQTHTPRYMAGQYLVTDEVASQFCPWIVEMRDVPNVSYSSLLIRANAGSFASTSLTANANIDRFGINFVVGRSGASTSSSYIIYAADGTVNAEL